METSTPIIPAIPTTPIIPIIPQPWKVQRTEGVFVLRAAGRIRAQAGCPLSERAARRLRESFAARGLPLDPAGTRAGNGGGILIASTGAPAEIGDEGYELVVEPRGIVLRARTDAGFFYGLQTLLQLALPAFHPPSGTNAAPAIEIPALRILDKPRFPWRGMQIDVSRHFQSKEYLKRFMDQLAFYKMNRFHLHLTDDEGWRVEIRKYPGLTSQGAWRKPENRHDQGVAALARENKDFDKPAEFLRTENGVLLYGGYYTQEDIRELVAYGLERHITLVPEIDVPGHASAAIGAYPHLSCRGGAEWGGTFSAPLCPGKESTFEFLEAVLSELIELFPCEYVHLGGDEVERVFWRECPHCQARIRSEGLRDEVELQSYVMRRLEKFLHGKGRRMIGWDEIIEGGLSPTAVVMYWRHWFRGGDVQAVRQGNSVIMAPCLTLYFNGEEDDRTLTRVYNYEPVSSDLNTAECRQILGVEGQTWSEHIPSPARHEYLAYPRVLALSEVAWTAREGRDLEGFLRKLEPHNERFLDLGTQPRPIQPRIEAENTGFTDRVTFAITHPFRSAAIRYTLDGSEVTTGSPLYSVPLTLAETTTVSTRAFFPRGCASDTLQVVFRKIGFPCRLEARFVTTSTTDPVCAVDEREDTWFEAGGGLVAGDLFTLSFPRPVRLRAVRVAMASAEKPNAYLHDGVLEASADGISFEERARLDGAEMRIPMPDEPVRAVRLRVTRDTNELLLLRHFLPVPIATAAEDPR